MSAGRGRRGALVDLLERALDKGLVLNADLVICVAGVPLVGVVLRAAVAGMDTMIRYGLLAEWDRELRRRRGDATRAGGGVRHGA